MIDVKFEGGTMDGRTWPQVDQDAFAVIDVPVWDQMETYIVTDWPEGATQITAAYSGSHSV